MTFDHRVMRITTVLSVSLAVAAPSLLVLAVMLDNLPVPVAAIVVMGVIVLVLPGALVLRLRRFGEDTWESRHRWAFDAMVLSVFWAAVAMCCQTLGGFPAAVYTFFFLLVLLAAVQLAAAWAYAYGVVCSATIAVTAWSSGTLPADSWSAVAVACIALLAMTALAVALTRALWDLRDQAEAGRAALSVEVDRLSTELDLVASGDLSSRIDGASTGADSVARVWTSLDGTLSSVHTRATESAPVEAPSIRLERSPDATRSSSVDSRSTELDLVASGDLAAYRRGLDRRRLGGAGVDLARRDAELGPRRGVPDAARQLPAGQQRGRASAAWPGQAATGSSQQTAALTETAQSMQELAAARRPDRADGRGRDRGRRGGDAYR